MRRPSSARLLAAAVALTAVSGATVAGVDALRGDATPTAAVAPAVSPTPTPTPTPRATPPKVAPAKPKPAATKPKPVARAPLYPLPAGPVQPQPCPPPPLPPGKPQPPLPAPKVAESRLPAPVPVDPSRRADLTPVTGKGIWLTTWATSKVDVAEVVGRARSAGLRQIWVRTGGTYQGWYGDRLLADLLPAAHRAGIAVIAWDFPTLSDPVADAARAKRALDYRAPGGDRLDGFSPDIETSAERVYVSDKRFTVYISRVTAAAGNRVVVATVPRPTPKRLQTYPYRSLVPYVDAFAPMVYWSCKEPGELVQESLRTLARWRPVHLVGQSYDMGPEGGRRGLPSGREIWRFLDASKRGGGVGASLYLYSQTGPAQWQAIDRYPWR